MYSSEDAEIDVDDLFNKVVLDKSFWLLKGNDVKAKETDCKEKALEIFQPFPKPKIFLYFISGSIWNRYFAYHVLFAPIE